MQRVIPVQCIEEAPLGSVIDIGNVVTRKRGKLTFNDGRLSPTYAEKRHNEKLSNFPFSSVRFCVDSESLQAATALACDHFITLTLGHL